MKRAVSAASFLSVCWPGVWYQWLRFIWPCQCAACYMAARVGKQTQIECIWGGRCDAGSGDAVVNSTCEFLVSSELNTNTYTDGIIGACGYFVYLSFYVPYYSGNPIIILTTTPPISSQAGSLKHIHVYHFIKKTTTNIFLTFMLLATFKVGQTTFRTFAHAHTGQRVKTQTSTCSGLIQSLLLF